MKRPPIFPPPQFPPVKLRLFQRMPPAVFPVIMGLFGLGLALRRGAPVIGYPPAIAELLLGAVSVLWLFAAIGFVAKCWQRPAVVMEDLAVLPGRAGLAAMTLGIFLLAAVALPYGVATAKTLLLAGLLIHSGLVVLMIRSLLRMPPEGRGVTPVWHLHFVGYIIAGLSAAPMGYMNLTTGIFYVTLALAAMIWGVSLMQLVRRVPPAPLRPLLAIHLAPASLFGSVALLLDLPLLAQGFAALGGAMVVAMVIGARWITGSGFSALWGAFTFPIAAYSSLLLGLGGAVLWSGWVWFGLIALIVAIGVVAGISVKVLRAWTGGTLAAKTNAATA